MTSLENTAAHLHLLAKSAVQADITGENIIGMSLSGGLDSSSVYKLTGNGIPCFTGYYEGERYDERPYASLVAGDEWHEIKITPQDFIENFDWMLKAAKPPYQGPGTFGQYMVAKYASKHIEVMLSGEGGDELFGGYARLLIVAGEPRPDGYENYQLPDGYPDTLEAALEWDYERLPDLLAVDDQMTSAWGIEARAPFTNPTIVDFVLSIPAKYRVGKQLLKQAMRGIVPDEILGRTDKRGFPTPFVEWAQGPIREFVHDRIGYVPDPAKPWDRGWWHDLCNAK